MDGMHRADESGSGPGRRRPGGAQGASAIGIRGFDTDNDSAFINETVFGYCRAQGIEFTRSRPRRKNDQAWIERKNGAVVRRSVGYQRLEGVPAVLILRRLYDAVRL